MAWNPARCWAPGEDRAFQAHPRVSPAYPPDAFLDQFSILPAGKSPGSLRKSRCLAAGCAWISHIGVAGTGPLLTASQVFSTAEVPGLSHWLQRGSFNRLRNLRPSFGRHCSPATPGPGGTTSPPPFLKVSSTGWVGGAERAGEGTLQRAWGKGLRPAFLRTTPVSMWGCWIRILGGEGSCLGGGNLRTSVTQARRSPRSP